MVGDIKRAIFYVFDTVDTVDDAETFATEAQDHTKLTAIMN